MYVYRNSHICLYVHGFMRLRLFNRCEDSQTSADLKGDGYSRAAGGALTTAFVSALSAMPFSHSYPSLMEVYHHQYTFICVSAYICLSRCVFAPLHACMSEAGCCFCLKHEINHPAQAHEVCIFSHTSLHNMYIRVYMHTYLYLLLYRH